MSQSAAAEFRERLDKQKAELTERIDKIKADITGGLEADSAEQATQLENRDVQTALVREGEAELVQISAALRRIDDGTFGTCVVCGESISPERLEARPYSSECIGCASRHE